MPLPVSTNQPEPGVALPGSDGILMIRRIVVGWEKLRLVYNLVLLVPGVILAVLYFQQSGLLVQIIFESVMFGLGANLCYCLGPYVELVFAAMGYPETGRRVRPFLFGFGIFFGLFLMMCWVVMVGLL